MKSDHRLYPVEAFDRLATAEANHWWFRSRNQVLLWVLRQRCGVIGSLLEVGCGTGFVLEAIRGAYPQAELFGSEFFDEGLTHARKRVPSATFTQLDARVMTDHNRYDAIGAFDVIEHIEEDEQVLANLTRALRQGGKLLLTVPQHRWLWSLTDEHACHVRRYSRGELVDKVKRAGLRVEYVTSFVSLLVPLMWLSRRRKHTGEYDSMREFQISGWLNRILELVMRTELVLLKLGVRFPVGGSLLLLASKP